MDNAAVEKGAHPGQPEKFDSDTYGVYLAPIEHAVVGSSVRGPSGENLGASDIFKQERTFSFRPIILNSDLSNLDEVRKVRGNRFREGYFVLFGLDIDLLSQGYEQRLWLSQLNDNGEVEPRMKVEVVQYDPNTKIYSVVQDQAIIGKLAIDQDYQEFFDLEKEVDPETGKETGKLIVSVKSSNS